MTRIQLCGTLAVTIADRRIEEELPGRQGRLVFAYLVSNRTRPTSRSSLIEALWPSQVPLAADATLSGILSRLRRVLGAGVLDGKSQLRIVLPDNAWIDVEVAVDAVHRAEAAVALGEWTRAWAPARIALHVSTREFMHGFDSPWIDERRRYFHALRLSALECVAAVGLGLDGPELAATERSARTLIQQEPFRETGYRLLMQALARRDNVAEAMRVYEGLRRLLREELGLAPAAATQELHKQLLKTTTIGAH
ncbi:MAG TPA: BTAD domain-containing putative transcriptional regulator [Gaiellaceae bacterium]